MVETDSNSVLVYNYSWHKLLDVLSHAQSWWLLCIYLCIRSIAYIAIIWKSPHKEITE